MKINQGGMYNDDDESFTKGDRLEIELYDGIMQYGVFTRFTQSLFGYEELVLTHISSPVNPEGWTTKIKIKDIIRIKVLK